MSRTVSTSSDNITVSRWMDSNAVDMIFSFADKKPLDTVSCWDGSKKCYIEFSCPNAGKQYDRFMVGIDMADRRVTHYPHAVKICKVYIRIIPVWIPYWESNDNWKPLLEFKAYIANSLLKTIKKRGRPSKEVPECQSRKGLGPNLFPKSDFTVLTASQT